MKLNFIQRYHADVEVGAKLTLDAGQSVKTMKDFKNEIKAANEELLNTSARFGATSKEALAAAKRVAELKDNIADANETAKLFDPGNKFQVMGNAVRGLVGGFTALQGALALVGVEGEDLQKTLLKVQGALALTEGLNVIADVGKDFQRLGSILVQTLGKSGLIGVAIAGVAALTAVFIATRNANEDLLESTRQYNKAVADANVEVAKMKNIFSQAEKGIISKDKALEEYNSGIGQTIGQTKSLNEAEKLLADNADEYVKVQGLKAKANFLLQKSAELSAQAEIARLQLAQSGFANIDYVSNALEAKFKKAEDDSKKYLELVNTINNEIAATSTGFKTTTPAGDKKESTPKVQQAKTEEAELDLFYASTAENRLLRQQELQQKLLDNRRMFIEQGMALEQEDFDEKIRLLNAELDSEDAAARQRIAIAEYEKNARVAFAGAISGALNNLSDLIGKQTAAGKILAIASTTIDTYQAIVATLKNAAKSPAGAIPGYAIAQAIATGIFGFAQVIKIATTKVPGASGGGGSAGNAGSSLKAVAPLQPQAPQATNTLLNQQQLNQLGNATVRAFVVESDVSSQQDRIRRLNRAARL